MGGGGGVLFYRKSKTLVDVDKLLPAKPHNNKRTLEEFVSWRF